MHSMGETITSGKLLCNKELSSVLCDDLDGWDGREKQEGGDICIHMADPHCCTAEAKTTL